MSLTTILTAAGYQTSMQTDALRRSGLVGNIRNPGSNMKATSTDVEAGVSIKNWGQAFSAWGDFHAVQLLFLNHTLVPSTINNCIVGSSATAYPSGSFNIARIPDSGWSTPSGAIVVPAATGTDATARGHMPGMALGPKMTVRSVPRAAGEIDKGKFPLLVMRAMTLAGNTTSCYADLGTNFPALYDQRNEGFSILTTDPAYGADAVSTPGNWVTGPRESTPAIICFGAMFYYDDKFVSIVGVGDSTIAGESNNSSQRTPYAFKATARIRAAGKFCTYLNAGISGAKMSEINVHGKATIATVAPDIMILHSWTVNDDSSFSLASTWDNQWVQMMDLVAAQLAAGKQVLIITPLPNDSFSQAQNVFRLIQRQRVMTSGLPFVDVESLADSQGHWAKPASTIDGTHPVELGEEDLAALLLKVLNPMIP